MPKNNAEDKTRVAAAFGLGFLTGFKIMPCLIHLFYMKLILLTYFYGGGMVQWVK